MKPKTAKKAFDLFEEAFVIVMHDLNREDRDAMFAAHDVMRRIVRDAEGRDSEVLLHAALEVFTDRDPEA